MVTVLGILGKAVEAKILIGGYACHKNLYDCNYYQGWDGDHPEGKSSLCNSDSCLLVGISEDSYTKIPAALETYGLAWGTDANAFSQMALEYYQDPNVKIIDENSDCQLNYVIVIGDGAWTVSYTHLTLPTNREV